jgi:hypothetical protein
MKNMVKLFGIIALTAVIVFSMAACDPEGENNDPTYALFPAALAGTTEDGITWERPQNEYGHDFYFAVFWNAPFYEGGEVVGHFCNRTDKDSSSRYSLVSVAGDSYSVKLDMFVNSEPIQFTAKVGTDGTLTISDYPYLYSDINGTYTKRVD